MSLNILQTMIQNSKYQRQQDKVVTQPIHIVSQKSYVIQDNKSLNNDIRRLNQRMDRKRARDALIRKKCKLTSSSYDEYSNDT